MKKMRKFKEGVASFYIVAISTLILVIIAASFAAVIISELARTSNNDLSQSAYDAALAGVEDAKLAYYNYQSCKEGKENDVSGGLRCGDIIDWVEKGTVPGGKNSCDMVAEILGRAVIEGNGVLVQESSTDGNNMQQAYTCVTMTNQTKSVEGSVGENDPFTVKVKFEEETEAGENSVMDKIERVKVKWYSDKDAEAARTDDASFNGSFGKDVMIPPVIAVGMTQTGQSFNLSDFEMTQGNTTNRGTVYLAPSNDENMLNGNYNQEQGLYVNAYDGTNNVIKNKLSDETNGGFLKSNDKTTTNLPYAVFCGGNDDYACEATIEIPRPVGDNVIRNKDTFVFNVTLPYNGPTTHFSLEFYCGDGDECSKTVITSENVDESPMESKSNKAILDGVQVQIDSTGRANDLYRRVEAILTPGSVSYPIYAIDADVQKNLSPTCENDFIVSNCE